MAEEIDELKKKIKHYEEKLSLADSDIAIKGYLAYVNIVRQQVEYIEDFKIKNHIDGKKSENAMYERTQSIWEGLPDMISSMNKLKTELNIQFDAEQGKPKMTAASPQSMAK